VFGAHSMVLLPVTVMISACPIPILSATTSGPAGGCVGASDGGVTTSGRHLATGRCIRLLPMPSVPPEGRTGPRASAGGICYRGP
jgi:hypothetical protein